MLLSYCVGKSEGGWELMIHLRQIVSVQFSGALLPRSRPVPGWVWCRVVWCGAVWCVVCGVWCVQALTGVGEGFECDAVIRRGHVSKKSESSRLLHIERSLVGVTTSPLSKGAEQNNPSVSLSRFSAGEGFADFQEELASNAVHIRHADVSIGCE